MLAILDFLVLPGAISRYATGMDFSHIEYWVFDLDNTLYPAEMRLFDQIEARMEQFIMRELGLGPEDARRLRSDFWHNHGTTLAGLMADHGIAPDPFLEEVHDIDLTHMDQSPDLASAIRALGGHRAIYTNGSRFHGENVSRARGIRQEFHAVYGIEDADYCPKPDRAAFERVFELGNIEPSRAVMFEDDPRNLIIPAEMGMITVLIGEHDADHIHHKTDDLTGFLQGVR